MPRPKLSEDETRALILTKAMDLIGEYGAAKTTVADIARACGFSTANVHRVFGTKAEIRSAACHRMLTTNDAETAAAIGEAETAAAKLDAYVRTVHEQTCAALRQHRRMHEMVAEACEERWPEVTAHRARLLGFCRDIVAHGVRTGEFDVPDEEAAAFGLHMSTFSLFHPLMVQELQGAEDRGTPDQFLAFVSRALGYAGPGGPAGKTNRSVATAPTDRRIPASPPN